jgi:hypothetical protein
VQSCRSQPIAPQASDNQAYGRRWELTKRCEQLWDRKGSCDHKGKFGRNHGPRGSWPARHRESDSVEWCNKNSQEDHRYSACETSALHSSMRSIIRWTEARSPEPRTKPPVIQIRHTKAISASTIWFAIAELRHTGQVFLIVVFSGDFNNISNQPFQIVLQGGAWPRTSQHRPQTSSPRAGAREL